MTDDLEGGEGVDYVTCRLCGRRFKAIKWSHLVRAHGLDSEHPVEEYKIAIRPTHTWSRATIARTVASRAVSLEESGQLWSRERVPREIRSMHARIGSVLLAQALSHDRDLNVLAQYARRFFGSWRAAVAAAGLEPNEEGVRHRWTRDRVLDAIRSEHAAGRNLNESEVSARFSALVNAARRQCGSWREAVDQAGVPLAHRREWTRESILAELKRRGSVSIRVIEKTDSGLCHAIYRYFGCYALALREAGLPPVVRSRRKQAASPG